MSGTPLGHGSSDRELTDVEKLKIAAVRTHLFVAADTREVFAERLSRLRGALSDPCGAKPRAWLIGVGEVCGGV